MGSHRNLPRLPMFSVTHNRVARMRLPGPPVRMLSNNLSQARVICTLQMYRVSVQIAMGLAHTWGDMPITGGYCWRTFFNISKAGVFLRRSLYARSPSKKACARQKLRVLGSPTVSGRYSCTWEEARPRQCEAGVDAVGSQLYTLVKRRLWHFVAYAILPSPCDRCEPYH